MSENTRALLIGKVLYFFLFAAMGIFIPFLNVYFNEIGLSGTQIGLVNTLGPLIAIFSGPMWGLLCDRLGRLRLVLGIVVLGAIASALVLSTIKFFLGILLVVAVFNLFASAIMPLVDSFNITLLGEHRERYSQQRLWGSFGFLASTVLSGNIFERVGLHGVFFGYALCLGLLFISLTWLPQVATRVGRTVLKGFTEMIRQPVWIVFSGAVILLMMANYSWVTFLGITIKEMGGSDALIGHMWSVGALSEIPVMLFGPRLLARWGAKRMIVAGFFFYGVRLILYAVMPHPEWALGINLMQGFSFGFYWLGSVNYVHQITPPHLRATGQSLLASYFNIAALTAGPMIGSLFDTFGSSRLYLIAAAAAWGGATIFVLGTLRLRARAVPAVSQHLAE